MFLLVIGAISAVFFGMAFWSRITVMSETSVKKCALIAVMAAALIIFAWQVTPVVMLFAWGFGFIH
jgi:hypothetical protein